ncbi:MAG: amino acid ABC transporter permease [Alphaproteobacteria bacterium]
MNPTITPWDRFLDSFFKLEVMRDYLPEIASGFLLTCHLALAVVATGLTLGLLLAIVRAYDFWLTSWLIAVFADVMRALPPLVFILLFYFGLPGVGLEMSGYTVTWLTLTLVLAAFSEEIFRAGILATPKGQREAARATGLGFGETLAFVIMPQAVRMTVPPLTNRTIAITKNTALGTVVGVGEILNQATTGQSFSGNASPLVLGAAAYLILFVPVVIFGRWVETRFAWRTQ